ncbi:DUF4402 domain-containing protein [Erythrobacter litoralis]|uniref:Spore coat protein U domain-containing protein n=1 Tax=Erythrobacter litoralis (strain HTCC2594) TaxID=314225 RepID=Q2N873_ERYLH|nr:DUF4402 domain-containing protein [Erythrobacter litoralis]ABC64118.1 hypothetical protein ELI_10130 [Erythrobacter litoralis HTCC2594]
MKSLSRSLALAWLAGAATCAGAAHAQPTSAGATATGQASVQIVRPLTVRAINDLDFGCIVASGAGTVSVDAASGGTLYSGGARAASSGGSCSGSAASFNVEGEQGREYRFSIERRTVARLDSDASVTLPVSDLQGRSNNLPAADGAGQLDADGRDLLRVGGTLEVPEGAPPGRYSARIVVTLAYN